MMTDYARLYAGLLSESDPRTIPKRQDKGPITQYHAEDLLRAPYELLESGEVRLSLYYPAAKKVEIEGHMFVCELHIDGDYHTGTCRVPPGFHPLKVFVDGSEVLDRYLPIGYGHGRPINYLSIPSGDDPRAVAEKERGSVEMVWLDSKIAGGYQRLFVYLPAQYHRSAAFPYSISSMATEKTKPPGLSMDAYICFWTSCSLQERRNLPSS